jgi:hypothetical protein
MIMVDFEDFPLDIIYEILGHLLVEDVVRARQVCFPFRFLFNWC